jgi:hypothetical protein
MNTFRNLEKVKLLKVSDGVKSNWELIKSKFGLINDSDNVDCSYAYSGYCPLMFFLFHLI